MEKVLEKSGNFVSPEKWERWYFDVHYERFPVVNPYFKILGSESFTRWLVGGKVIIAFKEFKPFFPTMYRSGFAPRKTYLSKL